MSVLSKSFAAVTASTLLTALAAPFPAVAGTLDRAVSDEELAALAAVMEQGMLGTGSCPWLHPVSETPTTIPCEAIPLPLLASMARNSANKQAQLELGKRYEGGLGLEKDIAKARKYYRMAARDLTRGRPVLVPGRDPSPLSFGEVGHAGTPIEAGLNRPRLPGFVIAVGLPEARDRLKALAD